MSINVSPLEVQNEVDCFKEHGVFGVGVLDLLRLVRFLSFVQNRFQCLAQSSTDHRVIWDMHTYMYFSVKVVKRTCICHKKFTESRMCRNTVTELVRLNQLPSFHEYSTLKNIQICFDKRPRTALSCIIFARFSGCLKIFKRRKFPNLRYSGYSTEQGKVQSSCIPGMSKHCSSLISLTVSQGAGTKQYVQS